MVLCNVWVCGSNSGKHKGLGFFRIPKIITNRSKKYEELTRKRRERWISAVSRGDTAEKNILETDKSLRLSFSPRTAIEGLRSVHTRLGTFPKFRKERISTSKELKASVERPETVERRWKAAIEQQEQETTKKSELLEQSGDCICDLDFESGAST